MIFRRSRSNKKSFECTQCGEVHSDWPVLGFNSPFYYHQLTEEEKVEAELNDDFCVLEQDEEVFRFIRVTLHQKIINDERVLDYGVWVSLSEQSFEDYNDHFFDEDHNAGYFGWLSNFIPPYEDSLRIPMDVHTRPGNDRPYVIPHPNHDHPFVRDFHHGISLEEAERRVHEILDNYT